MAVKIKYAKAEAAKPLPVEWPFPAQLKQEDTGQADAFAAALSKKTKSKKSGSDYPPWELAPGYTILEALKDYATNNWHGKELFLMSVNTPMRFKVHGYDPVSRRCQLESQDGLRIKPVVSEREVPLYSPFWK